MRLATALLFAAAAAAQPKSDIILDHQFSQDTSGWAAMGEGGEAHAADGALVFSYTVAAGKFAAAMLPTPEGIAQTRRMRFRIKTDHPTAVGVLLSEKKPGGGDYATWFWSPGNTWQEVELTPADFSVNDGPRDPVDSNGKLDLDQVQGIGILDLAFFLAAAAGKADSPMAVAKVDGLHTLQLAGFQMLSSPSTRANPGALAIDRFDRGFLEWMTTGGMELKLAKGGMEISYGASPGKVVAAVRRLAPFDLSRAARLAFDLESARPTTLAIWLELKGGGRYHVVMHAPGGRTPFHVDVPLTDFEAEGSAPAGLDPARLKTISLSDMTAAEGGEATANTLWIGNLQGLEKAPERKPE